MKPSELFGVTVRTIGVVLALAGLYQIFLTILMFGGGLRNVASMLFFGVPALLVGLWFLRGAKALISFAFPQDT